MDDEARRPRLQVAERPVQVEAALDLRVLSLVVERVHDPAPAALGLEAAAGRASRPPDPVRAGLAEAGLGLAWNPIGPDERRGHGRGPDELVAQRLDLSDAVSVRREHRLRRLRDDDP